MGYGETSDSSLSFTLILRLEFCPMPDGGIGGDGQSWRAIFEGGFEWGKEIVCQDVGVTELTFAVK